MSQFKVYQNSNSSRKKEFPYLLDIQTELLNELRTTVVIPLGPVGQSNKQALTRLCPILKVKGKNYIAYTQQLAGVNRIVLGREIEDLSPQRTEIIGAIDFLISGI